MHWIFLPIPSSFCGHAVVVVVAQDDGVDGGGGQLGAWSPRRVATSLARTDDDDQLRCDGRLSAGRRHSVPRDAPYRLRHILHRSEDPTLSVLSPSAATDNGIRRYQVEKYFLIRCNRSKSTDKYLRILSRRLHNARILLAYTIQCNRRANRQWI